MMADRFAIKAPFICTISAAKKTLIACLLLATCGLIPLLAHGQNSISLSQDMLLDSNALLMPSGSSFGRAINGKSHQTEPLVTFGGYQFATWYHNGANDEQDIYIARRKLSENTWSSFDTGANMVNGDEDGNGSASQNGKWDGHNVIGMGISGDSGNSGAGRIHLAYDHHVDDLRYLTTTGVNKATGSTWDASIFVNAGERDSFNAGGPAVTGVTYPRLASKPHGDLIAEYRTGGSGNGDTNIVSYNSSSSTNSNGVPNQRWGASHKVIDGTSNNAGSYSDAFNMSASTTRNAYLNGIDASANGKLHMTWTWRENSQGANHDIMYAYSEDGGTTWKNNAGTTVADATAAQTINLDTPGIKVWSLDRTQSLMNQQGQTVDQDGGVHALMWHRRDDDPQFAYESGDRFESSDSAYYHYYRDPDSGDWKRNQLPTTERVGSRPKIGYDANGDLYAVYTSSNDLIVAGATKQANFEDWSILYAGSQNFASDPILDQTRLLEYGVLSVFLQETGPSSTVATGSALRVLEFNVMSVPEPSHLLALSAAGFLALSRRRKRN